MEKRYICTESGLEKLTAARRLALGALINELKTGYDATCYLDDLDPSNKSEAQDELDNWAMHIPRWRIGEWCNS